MGPVILDSARRHGIHDDDMLHAYRHPTRVFELDDLTMIVGGDRAGRPLEVGLVTSEEGVEFVVQRHGRPPPLPEVIPMPRTIQDILDHAEALARRFEDYEPAADDEVDVAEHLLRRAALERARTEHQIGEAVVAARAAGLSWKRIGEQLGTSAQAAQQRYGGTVQAP